MKKDNTPNMRRRFAIENIVISGACAGYLMLAFQAGKFLYDSDKGLERDKPSIERQVERTEKYNPHSYKVMGRIIYDFEKSK